MAGNQTQSDLFQSTPNRKKGVRALFYRSGSRKSALTPFLGDAERTQKVEFLHEGIHQSPEERKALGFFGLRGMANDQDAHQDTYNDVASSFLEPSQ